MQNFVAQGLRRTSLAAVVPDISVPAADAYRAAQMDILKKQLLAENASERVERLKARMAELADETSAGG